MRTEARGPQGPGREIAPDGAVFRSVWTAWLRLFRVQNLVTVPGDALVGAAACGGLVAARAGDLALVCLASVLMYMYGLVDNDLVGAATDPKTRPVAAGEISPRAARTARTLCLCGAVTALFFGRGSFLVLVALTVAIQVYNRTKNPVLMGAARGLNVLMGGPAWLAAAVWCAYVAGVTKFSERETVDPTNGRKVARLVYGLLVLQAAALVLFLGVLR